jgi:hypothetical protein
MKASYALLRLLILVGMTASLMACSSNKSQPSLRARVPVGGAPGGQYPGGGGSFPGDPNFNQNCYDCGYIYNDAFADWRGPIAQFLMIDPSDQQALGQITGRRGSTTGVLIRGNVDPNGRSGTVEVIVWDSIAAQTGQAYVVKMQLDASRSNVNNSGATLVFQDQFGTMTLSGQFLGATYEGTVTFENMGQGSVNLGRFITGAYSLVR